MFYLLLWPFIEIIALLKVHERVVYTRSLQFLPPPKFCSLTSVPYHGSTAVPKFLSELHWLPNLDQLHWSLIVQQRLETFCVNCPVTWTSPLFVPSTNFLTTQDTVSSCRPFFLSHPTKRGIFPSSIFSFPLPHPFYPWNCISIKNFRSNAYEGNAPM